MAKAKKSTTRPKRASASAAVTTASYSGDGIIRQILANPALREAASGMASSMLSKFATNMSVRYPQISQLLHSSLETIEGKLAEFNGSSTMTTRNQ